MKIVLWIGNEANQKALANKIHSTFKIDGIVLESRPKSAITLQKLFSKIAERLIAPTISTAWINLKNHYESKYISYPQTKTLEVDAINSKSVFDFTKELAPDLIIVSGTSLIKDQLLSLKPKIGIINLHTGLSPYIKGGPNCTNWCLATKQFHLIGNTIMWLDAGIDSGNIIASETTAFTGEEDLNAIHVKVMEHAHELYLKAITKISSGTFSGIKQSDVGSGTTYYNKQWGLKEKIAVSKNISKFQQAIKCGEIKTLQGKLRTVN